MRVKGRGRPSPLEHRAQRYRAWASEDRDELLEQALETEPDPWLRRTLAIELLGRPDVPSPRDIPRRTSGSRPRTWLRPPLIVASSYKRSQVALALLRRTLEDRVLEDWSGLAPGEHDVDPTVEFRNRSQIRLAQGLVLRAGTILNGRSDTNKYGLALGPDTYIKERCYLDSYGGVIEIAGPSGIGQDVFMHGGGGITMGSYIIIGPGTRLISSNHRFNLGECPIMLQGDRRRGIEIGSNVWLGANVTVLDGISVGDNVVVGAGVILSKDVPPNSVVRLSDRTNIETLRAL